MEAYIHITLLFIKVEIVFAISAMAAFGCIT